MFFGREIECPEVKLVLIRRPQIPLALIWLNELCVQCYQLTYGIDLVDIPQLQ